MIRPQYLLRWLDRGTRSEKKKTPPNLRIPKARESKFKFSKGQRAAKQHKFIPLPIGSTCRSTVQMQLNKDGLDWINSLEIIYWSSLLATLISFIKCSCLLISYSNSLVDSQFCVWACEGCVCMCVWHMCKCATIYMQVEARGVH